ITLNGLTQFLEDNGYGLASPTGTGYPTLGGILATGSHGTGLPLNDEGPGRIFGPIANLILSLQAVVWNGTKGQYELQWFERSDLKIGPLMANLGLALCYSVQLPKTPRGTFSSF
ncbi:FAD-dependent oxidoreductase, partial [Acinetobacter baumannii]|nr:FAD-dependent oxidoreductase [Acinetobacter baumannii]